MNVAMIQDTTGQDVILSPKRHYKIGYWVAGVVVLLAVVLYLAQQWQHAVGTDMSVSRSAIRIAAVDKGDVQRDLSVQGKVVAANSPTLYSTAQGIVTYNVKAGDKVTQGQLLAVLDSPQTTSELKQQQATLAQLQGQQAQQQITSKRDLLDKQQALDLAKVDLLAAKRELARNEEARKTEIVSDREFQRSKDELSRAELVAAQSQTSLALAKQSAEFESQILSQQIRAQELLVAELQRQSDTLNVTSPVNGMVGSLSQAQKAAVPAYQSLLTVVDLSGYEVEVMVPESYADDLSLNMPVEISSNGTTYPGEIAAISPEITNNQVVARLRFTDAVPAQIRQNQRLSGRILLENRQDILRLPRGNFIDSDSGRSAFVVQGDTATRVPIALGASGFSYVEVSSGLSDGQQVIISDTSRFKEANTLLLTK